jgi:hypothetical protein
MLDEYSREALLVAVSAGTGAADLLWLLCAVEDIPHYPRKADVATHASLSPHCISGSGISNNIQVMQLSPYFGQQVLVLI